MWWNIQQKDGGRFDIWPDGGPHIYANSRQELEQQLRSNGIVEELYQDVLHQLEADGKARVDVRLGKFSQM
jgi:hypothetical protein